MSRPRHTHAHAHAHIHTHTYTQQFTLTPIHSRTHAHTDTQTHRHTHFRTPTVFVHTSKSQCVGKHLSCWCLSPVYIPVSAIKHVIVDRLTSFYSPGHILESGGSLSKLELQVVLCLHWLLHLYLFLCVDCCTIMYHYWYILAKFSWSHLSYLFFLFQSADLINYLRSAAFSDNHQSYNKNLYPPQPVCWRYALSSMPLYLYPEVVCEPWVALWCCYKTISLAYWFFQSMFLLTFV